MLLTQCGSHLKAEYEAQKTLSERCFRLAPRITLELETNLAVQFKVLISQQWFALSRFSRAFNSGSQYVFNRCEQFRWGHTSKHSKKRYTDSKD